MGFEYSYDPEFEDADCVDCHPYESEWAGDTLVVEADTDLAQWKRDVEEKISSLNELLRSLQNQQLFWSSAIPALAQQAGYFEVNDALGSVKQMTAEIFRSPAEYADHEDCEIAGERYIEVIVRDMGNSDQALARHDEWHRRLALLPANVRRFFRLTIDMQSE